MEKAEAAERLKKAGYQVQFDSSIMTVVLGPKENTGQTIKKLRTFFKEIGYDASFGIRQAKNEPAALPDNGDESGEPQQFSLEDFGLR